MKYNCFTADWSFKPGAPAAVMVSYNCFCPRMSVCVCACVCPSLRLLITSGVIYTLYDWLNNFLWLYMAAVVGIVSGRDLSIHTCSEKVAQ